MVLIGDKISCIYRLCSACLVFKILKGMSATYFITDTSRNGWTMVRSDTIEICSILFCPQYQFVFALIQLRYSSLTASSPA